jgi:hypothetical protein
MEADLLLPISHTTVSPQPCFAPDVEYETLTEALKSLETDDPNSATTPVLGTPVPAISNADAVFAIMPKSFAAFIAALGIFDRTVAGGSGILWFDLRPDALEVSAIGTSLALARSPLTSRKKLPR